MATTPRPEPSPQPPLEVEKPRRQLHLPRRKRPSLIPLSPIRQALGNPWEESSPPSRDLHPDAGRQLAALTPAKTLKEAVPIYRQNPPPGYPRIARRKGYEGTVVLEVLVGREGRVSDLRLFHSCGHTVLDEAAADSVRSWLFDPGKLDNDPVEMWVKVPIRFQLKE